MHRISSSIHRKAAALSLAVMPLGFVPIPAAAWDPWPCEVALCLANPAGPLAVAECVGPIKRAWRAWARGKGVPRCMGVDAQGREYVIEETKIDNTLADPNIVDRCPKVFTYYAGKEKTKHCAFTGVTDQYIEGDLWGRLWYGGFGGGRYYIEYLQDDPNNPRPFDSTKDDFAPIKADIERKADIAAIAWQKSIAADAAAQAAKAAAITARNAANVAWGTVAWLENQVPLLVADNEAKVDAYGAEVADIGRQYAAAKAKAESPKGTWEDWQRAERLAAWLEQAKANLQRAKDNVAYYRELFKTLPAKRQEAQQLEAIAVERQAEAERRHAEAEAARAEMQAADLAARPLPPWDGR